MANKYKNDKNEIHLLQKTKIQDGGNQLVFLFFIFFNEIPFQRTLTQVSAIKTR
jgi:hypothetical protein